MHAARRSGANGQNGGRAESFMSRLQSASPGPSGYGPTEDDLASINGGGPYGAGEHGMERDESRLLAEMLEREDEEMDDMKRICRIWVKERGTPDIMQWEGDLIDNLMNKLEQQVGHLLVSSSASTSEGCRFPYPHDTC